MAIMCTVCSEWYPAAGRDTLDICPTCLDKNFSGAWPPLDWAAPRVETARENLEACVRASDASRQITLSPRQVQAMRRMHERWAARSDAAIRQWEDDA